MRIALTLALALALAACSSSGPGDCETRLKARLNGDPRWKEIMSPVSDLFAVCRARAAGTAEPADPAVAKQLDCIIDVLKTDAEAFDQCAGGVQIR